MIDLQLELFGTCASLAADFLKAHEHRTGSQATKEFETWLKEEVFPALIARSEQALKTVVSLKAHHHQQYETLLEHILAIRQAVAAPTPIEVWNKLQEWDRQLLKYVFDRVRDDPLVNFSGSMLQNDLGRNGAELVAAARYLDEVGWLSFEPYSGEWFVSPRPTGIDLSWSVSDPQDHEDAMIRLTKALPEDGQATRLQKLASEARVPLGLTYFVICKWASEHLLKFDDNASPFEQGLIYNVSQSFIRSSRAHSD